MTTAGPTSWLLLVLIIALPVTHALALIRQGRFLLIDPLCLFWAGFFVCYVLQAWEYGEDVVALNGSQPFLFALGWVIVSELSVIAGYHLKLGVRLGWRIPHVAPSISTVRLVTVAAVFVGLGVLGYAYLMTSAGGVGEWLAVGRGATDWESRIGYVSLLEHLLPVGIALLMFAAEFARRPRALRGAAWLAGAVMWLWFLYLGSRYRVIAFSLTMVAAFFLPRRRRPPLLLGLCLLPLLYAVVNFQEFYRGQFTGLSFNLDSIDPYVALRRVFPAASTSGDTEGLRPFGPGLELNCVVTAVRLVPDKVDYNYGYGHLEVFTRWIPRAIWPDKVYPLMESVQPILLQGGLSDTVIPTASKELVAGPAFTFVGHWYAVGGGIAIALAGLATGVLFRGMRTMIDRVPGDQGDVVLYTMTLPIAFSEATFTPLNWVYSLPFAIAPLVVALRWARRRQSLRRAHRPRATLRVAQ